jgi:hypothetical protein
MPVKGTAFDGSGATIAPAAVAQKFWDLYHARRDVCAHIFEGRMGALMRCLCSRGEPSEA